MAEVEVTHNRDAHRYEARVDSGDAGFVEYQEATDLVVITHTEVDPAHEGQGVGSALARAILDDIRRRQVKALVVCPFVNAWISRHPDYADLLYGAPPSRVTD